MRIRRRRGQTVWLRSGALIELELEQPQAPAGQQPQQSKRVSLAQRSTESRTAPYVGVLRGRGYAVHFFSRPLKTSKFVNAPLTEQSCECRMRVRRFTGANL